MTKVNIERQRFQNGFKLIEYLQSLATGGYCFDDDTKLRGNGREINEEFDTYLTHTFAK